MKVVTVILLFFIGSSLGFKPSSLFRSSASDASATHETITRCSLATVTAEYFGTRFSIYIEPPRTTNGICRSTLFASIRNAFNQTKSQGGSTYSQWENTVDEIIEENKLVDLLEQFDSSRHFDSESFIEGSRIVLRRFQSAVSSLKRFDYDRSNEYFGAMTHTLQDFYSHSNWIEMNRRQPHPDLGNRIMSKDQFAGPSVRTCSDCNSTDSTFCRGNNDVSKGLTSGYFSALFDIFNRKPKGKCSHGGALDGTTDNDATGGINKDESTAIHGYLHVPAAQTAYLATCELLRKLHQEVGQILFGKFLNVLNRRRIFEKESENMYSHSSLYAKILSNIRMVESFSVLQEIVSIPANDSYYKAHVISLARRKNVMIDIFRTATDVNMLSLDYGQELAFLTGGFNIPLINDNQTGLMKNVSQINDFISFFLSRRPNDTLNFTFDQYCSNFFFELMTTEFRPLVQVELINHNRSVSLSAVSINTTYYKSYQVTELESGFWRIAISSLNQSMFDVRLSCSHTINCFSRIHTENGNVIHNGSVELHGNPIEKQKIHFVTSCDTGDYEIDDLHVTLIDAESGIDLSKQIRSEYDFENDQWRTMINETPSGSFRLKYSINNEQIQRVSPFVYRSSSIDVEIYQFDTDENNTAIIDYKLINYRNSAINVTFIAKNVGQFQLIRQYKLEPNEIHRDQLLFHGNRESQQMIGEMLTLTVVSDDNDWNYDIVNL